MAELEKVIKGLECCILHDPDDKQRCSECPYEGNCVNRLKMDALSLLKAQEPRVMTLEEMQEITEHDFIWIEGRKDGMIYCLEVAQVCKSNERTDEITLNAPTSIIFIDMDQYKDRWRCWTARPTDEQREKVKWE